MAKRILKERPNRVIGVRIDWQAFERMCLLASANRESICGYARRVLEAHIEQTYRSLAPAAETIVEGNGDAHV